LEWRKPMFPLLLNGDNWELFVLTQFASVEDEAMPDGELLRRLGEHVTPRGKGENKSRLTTPAPSKAAPQPQPPPKTLHFDVDDAIAAFGTAYRARNWSEALKLLGRIRASGEDPSPFDPDALERRVQSEIEVENRAREEQAWLAERDKQYIRLRVLESFSDPETVWAALQTFWKTFPDYDPDGIAEDARPRDVVHHQDENVGRTRGLSPLFGRQLNLVAEAGTHSAKLLPAPFAWIDIPGSTGKTWKDAPYKIGKYPVTNAQFKLFVDAEGYGERRWWTEAGWEERQKEGWTQPRYWRDSKWNGVEQPVVGVSWYETVAFCLWLSEVTGESIVLPTGYQWIYAAQGDDGRAYPWGNDWNCKKCNNSVPPCKSSVTTPVRQYEGKGDSPFGVVDMSGNVGEWCLSDKYAQRNYIQVKICWLCGGSWNSSGMGDFRFDDPKPSDLHHRFKNWGFRLARLS
jgi:hypothetical protein